MMEKDLRRQRKLVSKLIWRGDGRKSTQLRTIFHGIRAALSYLHIGNDYRLLRQPNQLDEDQDERLLAKSSSRRFARKTRLEINISRKI